MLKYTSVLLLVVLPNLAFAEDWTGQIPIPPISGPIGPYQSTQLNTTKLIVQCYGNGPNTSPPPCGSGQTAGYFSDDIFTNLNALPFAATAPGSDVGVAIGGGYADPNSPTGISSLGGQIPLSAFARSSTVDYLQASLGIQQQQMLLQDKVALQGIASALAMAGGGDLGPDENFAVSGNWGTFGGQNAFAGSFSIRAADHLTFNGGMAASISGGPVGGRAGFRFAW